MQGIQVCGSKEQPYSTPVRLPHLADTPSKKAAGVKCLRYVFISSGVQIKKGSRCSPFLHIDIWHICLWWCIWHIVIRHIDECPCSSDDHLVLLRSQALSVQRSVLFHNRYLHQKTIKNIFHSFYALLLLSLLLLAEQGNWARCR